MNESKSNQRHSEDESWIEQVKDVYSPPPMTPMAQRAFDERLEDRLNRRPLIPWSRIWQPAAAASCAAAVLWLVQSPSAGPSVEPVVTLEPAAVAAIRDWEMEVLAASELADFEVQPLPDMLPGDYQALAGVLVAQGD